MASANETAEAVARDELKGDDLRLERIQLIGCEVGWAEGSCDVFFVLTTTPLVDGAALDRICSRCAGIGACDGDGADGCVAVGVRAADDCAAFACMATACC